MPCNPLKARSLYTPVCASDVCAVEARPVFRCSLSKIIKHKPKSTFYSLERDFCIAGFSAVISVAIMKIFSRPKPTTTVDGQRQGSEIVPNEQKMNCAGETETFQTRSSPSPVCTSAFQDERLENMKLALPLSSSDFDEKYLPNDSLEREFDLEDTDVWYADGSVECVLGAC